MATLHRRSPRVVTDSEDDSADTKCRRNLQLTRNQDIIPEEQLEDKRKRNYIGLHHTIPIHTVNKPSVLSKEAPPENYSGFIRLGMLVLGASNVRLVIENWMKYGLLIRFPHSYIPLSDYGLFMLAWITIPVCVLLSLFTEFFMAAVAMHVKDGKSIFLKKLAILEHVASGIHIILLTLLLIFPSYIVYTKIYHPFIGSAVLVMTLVTFLKLISYMLVNREMRQLFVSGKEEEVYKDNIAYPNNIRLSNITYFFFAPTLCYQPAYPRTPKFRLTFFLKRVGELIVCLVMMYALAEQYAKPTLENSMRALEEKNLVTIVERVLKLSTTAVVIWLLMFYAMFHAFLNAVSEVLRFGDRTFYLAWWNSGNLATYWRLWNRPVYLFFKRHVYLPSVRAGLPPSIGQLMVFLVSAALHEMLVGIPTHALTGFAFWGMLGQIPLIAITQPLERWRGKGSALGNTLFWITFCVVGQPTIALLYYYQWTVTHKAMVTV